MQKNIYNEQIGISYTLQGDYYKAIIIFLTLHYRPRKENTLVYGGSVT